MKKLFLLLLIVPMISFGQNNINYQAVVYNSSGTVISSQSIGVKLSVIYTNANSGAVYSETHTTTTTSSGLINIKLGSGGTASGTFANIDWSTPSISLKSEVDIGNGYVNMGTQQIEAVPVALYANNVNLLDANNTIAIGGVVSATNSVAIGKDALAANTSGADNTAVGYESLSSNTTGSRNTANGLTTLYSNTTGGNNTASGYYALHSNSTGNRNTAYGSATLSFNNSGSENTAIGYTALYYNTTGNSNTAIGGMALNSNTTGVNNTANGLMALFSNTTGNRNTANGNIALENNTTGSGNVANGEKSLFSNTTGANNTAIGNGADVGSNNLTNATAIGNGAIVTASNTIQLGSASVTLVQTSGTISATAFVGDGSGLTGISGPIYKSSMVLQSSSTAATDSQIDLPGLSFRWKKDSNGVGKLEVKAESDNAPQALIFYFSYHTDSNDTINFRPDTTSASTSSWNAVDCSWCASSSPPPTGYTPNLPSITGSYAVYEFDFSVYPLNTSGNHLGKTYNVKLFLGGWGGVHMRASYQ
ncbi:hypothetical protein N9H73_05825 [Flavobacteriaceae bacterium]|nr:hypothetical protein [Flavobacteriaceae bacterium]